MIRKRNAIDRETEKRIKALTKAAELGEQIIGKIIGDNIKLDTVVAPEQMLKYISSIINKYGIKEIR
jgi:hypothetical protein